MLDQPVRCGEEVIQTGAPGPIRPADDSRTPQGDDRPPARFRGNPGFDALEGRRYRLDCLGAGLAILANQLPINGFAGFGAQDVGWVAGFTALGVAREAATASGLGAHLVYLFNIALFGLAGQVGMGMVAREATGGRSSQGPPGG